MNAPITIDTKSSGECASPQQAMGHTQVAAHKNDEQMLVLNLLRGDELVYEQLVTKHRSALIRTAMRYVADYEVAEEVVQDTWITVIENLHRFEGRSSLRTWIFGILIHKAIDRGVREKRHSTFSALKSPDDTDGHAGDPPLFHRSDKRAGHWAFSLPLWDEQTPEKLLASKQAIEAMNNAIEDLPPPLKIVLILRDLEQKKVSEVCDMLKITETNLYVRIHRARERVRESVDSFMECSRRAMQEMPTRGGRSVQFPSNLVHSH